MKPFGIIVNLGGRTKKVLDSASKISYVRKTDKVFGLSEYLGPKGNDKITGARVFIYSRQTKRELADTFFHEMAHVFFEFLGGKKKQGKKEEFACRWIGYLAKMALADYSQEYCRKTKG